MFCYGTWEVFDTKSTLSLWKLMVNRGNIWAISSALEPLVHVLDPLSETQK